ncbi:MAG: LacI family DNA-binding transcriptional regulator [Capsulimonadaceae bacterium]
MPVSAMVDSINAVSQRPRTRPINIGIVSEGFPTSEIALCHYGAATLNGVLCAAQDRDLNVIVFARLKHDSLSSIIVDTVSDSVDGMIVIAPKNKSEVIRAMVKRGIPVVGVGASTESVGAASVSVDSAHSAKLAMEHLIALGHRRIAHLAGPSTQASAADRREKFLLLMCIHGLDVPPHYVVETAYHGDGPYEAAFKLLISADRPTAIFAANDYIALETLRAAREIGIPTPERLSVVGFDDVPAARLSRPQLTTIRQPLVELGERATHLLLDIIAGEPVAASTRYLQTELVIRESTSPV